jgi:hypothetical protein
MAATTAGWVGSGLCGDRRRIAGGWHGCWFVLARGAVGLCFAHAVLHVTFFHDRDIVGPLFGYSLGA